jgi:hypothetical protein
MTAKEKRTVARVARAYLLKHIEGGCVATLCDGNLTVMGDIFKECHELGVLKLPKRDHPLNRILAVLNAVDRNSQSRNPLFTKRYVRYSNGRGEVLHRDFVLTRRPRHR